MKKREEAGKGYGPARIYPGKLHNDSQSCKMKQTSEEESIVKFPL